MALRWWPHGLAAALISISGFYLYKTHVLTAQRNLFWDLYVYRAAVRVRGNGGNPYFEATAMQDRIPDFLHFTSPPLVTYVLSGIAALGLNEPFSVFLVVAHLVSFAGIAVLLTRLFFGHDPVVLAVAFGAYMMLFQWAGVGSFGACNNGTPLYFAILLGLTRAIERADWTLFFGAVFVATLIKPFYAAFFIVPVLLDGFAWGQFKRAAITVVLAVGVYFACAAFDPVTTRDWLAVLAQQTLNQGDAGGHIFGYVRNKGASVPGWLPALAFCMVAGLIGLLVLAGPEKRLPRLAALIIAAMYANPRAQFYDWSVIAVPLVYLTGEIMRAQHPAIAACTTRNQVAMATLVMVILTAATTHSWFLAWNPSLVVPLVVLATVGLWSLGFAERRNA
jgi:hypothetical protein